MAGTSEPEVMIREIRSCLLHSLLLALQVLLSGSSDIHYTLKYCNRIHGEEYYDSVLDHNYGLEVNDVSVFLVTNHYSQPLTARRQGSLD